MLTPSGRRASYGLVAPVAALLVALGSPESAAAQSRALSMLSVRGELGVGGMLPDYQTTTLDYGLGVGGAIRVGLRPIDPFVLQLSYESWLFPSDSGDGQQHTIGGGVRIEPLLGDLIFVIADANAGLAFTGDLRRFTFNVGLGAEIGVERVVGLGAFVRFAHTFATSADYPSDASMIIAGISLTLRGVRPASAPGDRDGDGVRDDDDLCPDTHHGDHPDPSRPGCPLGDRDSDGVFDRDDLCPDTPQGDNPDPARPGCPAGDADGDGVLDAADACPTTPRGPHPDPARPGCPAPDSDSDGVPDPSDLCPQEHMGLHPDPSRPGCPLPDRDRDTVVDGSDACPDEFGAPQPDPRRNGCPGLVRIEGGQIRIMRPVFFATDRDVILPESQPVLQAVADALEATPVIRRISIEGHTDDVGSDAYNMDLSQRRAQNVMAWLIRAGIEASRLEAHGYGESRPIIAATTDQARGVNRRVEFRIVDPPVSGDDRPGGAP